MNNDRIVSIGTNSMIYHKPGCRYTSSIKNENKLLLSKKEAKQQGYHVCRYCNSMNHHYRVEQSTLNYYARCKNMEFKYIDGILYVKSEIGCWKLIYIRKEEKIALYHRNTTSKPLDFDHPQYEEYHRQADKPYCNSIEGYLDYIYKHDQYKAAIQRGEKVTRFSSKKYAKYEPRAKRKREIKRVEYLFRMLEKENVGYRVAPPPFNH